MRNWWAVLLTVGAVWADGCLVPERVSTLANGPATAAAAEEAQTAWVAWQSGVEWLTVAVNYRGPAQRLCWLLPVPGTPTPADLTLSDVATLGGVFARTDAHESLARRPPALPHGPLAFTNALPLLEAVFATAGRDGPERTHGGAAVGASLRWQAQRGRYEVSALTARTGAALAAWLDGAGFVVPAGLAPVADEYLQRGWSFVAARIPPERAGAPGPLPPLTVRFASARPVFPLRISRLGAAPATLLRLVVTAPGEPCSALEGLGDDLQRGLGPAVRFDGKTLPYTVVRRVPDSRPALWDKRYHLVVERDRMVDLEWTVEPESGTHRIYETDDGSRGRGSVWYHLPWSPLVVLSGPLGMLLLWWLATALRLWAADGWSARRGSLAAAAAVVPLALACQVLGLVAPLVCGVVLCLLWLPLGLVLEAVPSRLLTSHEWVGMVLQLPLLLLTLAVLWRALTLAGGRLRVPWTVWPLVLLAALALGRGTDGFGHKTMAAWVSVVPWSVALPLCLVATLAGRDVDRPLVGRGPSRRQLAPVAALLVGLAVWQPYLWPLALVLVMTAGVAALAAWGLRRLDREPATRPGVLRAAGYGLQVALAVAIALLAVRPELNNALDTVPPRYTAARDTLDAAVRRYHADTGLLPLRLEDLLVRQSPAQGLDVAGTPWPLGAGWRGPYLPALPGNALRGGRVEWAYEPTGELLVRTGPARR